MAYELRTLSENQNEQVNTLYIYGKPEDERIAPICLVRADGDIVYDAQNRSYIDYANSLNLPFGHGAMQFSNGILAISSNYETPQRAAATQIFDKYLSSSGIVGYQFRSSGTEAVEAALRYFLNVFSKGTILSLQGCYHGLTLGAQYLMGQDSRPANFLTLAFPNDKNCGEVLSFVERIAQQGPALIFLEPVQGATLRKLPDEFLRGLNEIRSSSTHFLIVADSMLASIRCGTFTGFTAPVDFDFFIAGKCLAQGFPFSVIGISARARALLGDVLGTTSYGGNPRASEIVTQTVKRIYAERLFERIEDIERSLRNRTERWINLPCITRCEVHGLLFGVDFISTTAAKAFANAMLENGLLSAQIGSLVRLSPPLNVSSKTMEASLAIIEKTLAVR
ncbi:aminotransferase class III-fold pyridoxal phosphate-dependent enzyme [Rhizobium sp. VS19-DR104.2]|uniref:aminotransferase class III-fold pyridoxal phosphate-dependent enzyme n=1 Tax=unclassified Rhizobium TaxID=2613769 RepID=UPI001CC81D71|nr:MULTISPECIES: aminotransferase class III-fold pyridoxal phosphate-dependent enzyme [unclassified Rhizobium]MBZ5763807.1 aminotransferase class III-fold pyridoxal phosphate-dependent enzyme [Rhizobium sp. VS19-DR96]MBZ5769736.1 aminotransferase class III-fold pyridoxal phosphate-dependent enzyme [Rhizobium sp. VS19-DR129.2]MBZ5777278.1 aminotransferase class III-fold pyridoxal phosphate-dependent enzyme [Rhizobium sp. VS19-DRK62.2]MBZ5788406.1 aminotransferase class III-fold pyridoxal phospha